MAVASAPAPVAAVAANEKSTLDGNFVRRKTDYLWMLVILGGMATAAQHFFPQRCVLEYPDGRSFFRAALAFLSRVLIPPRLFLLLGSRRRQLDWL